MVIVLRVSVGRHSVTFAERGMCSDVSSLFVAVRMVMMCFRSSSNVL